jgi:hypothetical protein
VIGAGRPGRVGTALAAGAAVAVAAAWCRAPGVVFADAGELLTAVSRGGAAHPPGFPLYLLLGGAWLSAARAAGLGAASALNLFSALSGGAAAALVAAAAFALLDRVSPSSPEGRRRLLAAGAGLLAGFGPTLFDFSLSIEVYALHAVCLAGALACALAAGGDGAAPRRLRLAAGAGLFAGGGLAVHHATMAVVVPGLLLLLWEAGASRKERLRGFVAFSGALLPGLAAYLVLPLRAAVEPPLNWGNPSNLFRFWVHVTARDYQVNLDGSLEKTMAHAGRFLDVYAGEFSAAGLAVAAVGLAVLLARWPRGGAALLAAALCDFAFAVRYEIAEDQAAYYIPVFLVTALAGTAGAAFLAEERPRFGASWSRALLVLLLAGLGALCWRNASGRAGRRYDRRAPEAAGNLLASAGPGALVLTSEWNLYAPVLAAQEVEGMREDVLVVDVLLLRRGWYLDALARRWPVRITGAEETFRRYRSKLADWEEGRPYRGEELSALYEEFTRKLAESAWSRGLEVLWVGPAAGGLLPARAALVPEGIAYRVLPERAAAGVRVDDAPVSFEASLREGLPLDEVYEGRVRPLLSGMRLQRALLEDAFGRRDEARRALSQAKALAPDDPSVAEVEGDFLLRDGRPAEALERYAAAARGGGDAERLAGKSRAAQGAVPGAR